MNYLVHYVRSLQFPRILCAARDAVKVTTSPTFVTCRTCRRKLPLASQPEKQLLAQVRSLAKTFGFMTYHTHNSRKSEPGYPDLTLLKPRRLIFAELKREVGVMTVEQKEWLARLNTVPGVEAYLWKPSDIDQIIAILQRKS